MSAVARLLLARGDAVSGSDSGSWPLAEALVSVGATVHRSFDPTHVGGADVVLRSSAYGESNVEVRAALERGITLWRRHDAWRELARGQRVVAVAGTHGKTTATAMTWIALRGAGVDASLICGAVVRALGSNAHAGRDPTLVIEADEYDRTFLALEPAVALVTNVDFDHVDQFPTRALYAAAFAAFAARVTGTLVACADDAGARALRSPRRTTYGRGAEAEVRLADERIRPDGRSFLVRAGGTEASAAIRVAGAHNALNATGAIAAALACGIPLARAAASLDGFAGTERRLETLGTVDGVTVVDDYAHHPAELRASIEAMRPIVRGRLVALFQPHTPSRLAAFFDDFVSALALADERIVVETFASARERNEGDRARRLAERSGAAYVADADEAVRVLAARVRPDDLVLILGAGDVRPIGERLLAALGARSPA